MYNKLHVVWLQGEVSGVERHKNVMMRLLTGGGGDALLL